ncbi:hypothetical protein CTheo_7780 [Ceratobasidium theobromae]|uniref:Uncharacterized protein n=1 Tax=Ceratobasidium theobromae TaxID=1582974 RepID=A0A5N5QBH6_9AGAM|nr:hypothetical protein CTheo_7780 [Ceratobasidium theobromae]
MDNITVDNTVPVEHNEAWKLQRVTLHISPYITDRIVWKMLVWETNGLDSRIVDIFPAYDDINGAEGRATGVTVSLNLKDPRLVNLELEDECRGSFIDISMSQGNHGHLMSFLGINIIGSNAVGFRVPHRGDRVDFYLGILEHLSHIGILDPADCDDAYVYTGLIEIGCLDARQKI